MPSKYQVNPRSILRPSNPFSIISFGVVSMVITLLGVITASLAVALALGAINSPSAFATDSASASTDVTLNLSEAIYVRILDSTATTEITKLSFDFVPTTTGVSSTSRAVVEVGTSNLTGYKLYMESDYIDPNSTISTTENPNPTPVYTTSLVNTDTDIPSSIGTIPTITPASGAGSTIKNYWYYYNPFVSPTTSSPIGDSVIPAYGSPDRIGQLSTPTDSTLTNVDISVGVDTTIAAGIYQNQLLFTAIGNPIPTAYTLSFNLDGGSAPTSSPDAFDTMTVSEVSASHTFTIPNIVPEKARYTFAYWTDEAGNQYDPGDTITVIGSSGYVGAETLTANWEKVRCANGANRVCYIANEPSGAVEGIMEDQTIVYMTSTTAVNTVDETSLSNSTTELTLYSPNWTLNGYGFKGWNTAADGSGTMYGPNQTIALDSEQQADMGVTGLVLYAQWVASAGNMASWNGCSSLSQGDVTALTYDGDTYAIAKLADGKCWMIENLRTGTNAGTDTTTFDRDVYNSRQYNLVNISGADGAYPINATSPSAAIRTYSQYMWKSYGGYYSWASTINTANTSRDQYYNYDTATATFTPTGVTQGVCPTSWRIPKSYNGSVTNDQNSDFRYLNYVLNGTYDSASTAAAANAWRAYPNNFVFTGYWYVSESFYRGALGSYWSSTTGSTTEGCAHRLQFSSRGLSPATYNCSGNYNKRSGYTVRCVTGS